MRPVDLTDIPNALGGDGADIGAYEAQSAPTASTPTPTPTPIGGSVQFAVPQFDVIESDGVATVTITRNGDASTAASVSYTTADGTATQKVDYIFAAGTLSFAPGETSKSFTVLIVNDAYQEGTETFSVSLSNPVGTTLGARATAKEAMIEDELSPLHTQTSDQAAYVGGSISKESLSGWLKP